MPPIRRLCLLCLPLALASGCESRSSFLANNQVSPPAAPSLISQKILTRLTTQIPVTWRPPSDTTTISGYRLTVTDGSGNTVSQLTIPPDGISAGTPTRSVLPGPIPDGMYTLALTAVSEYALDTSAPPTSLQIDSTPPAVLLYLGADPVADPCGSPPTARADIATKLVPFDLCAADRGNGASGLQSVCVVPGYGGSAPPAADDPCWGTLDHLARLLALNNGANTVTAFAKDLAGNIASASGSISLLVGDPPSIDLLAPTAASIAQAPWHTGEQHPIQWKVTSDNSSYDEIKILITLVKASDFTAYTYLACNFTNSPVWTQCPNPSIESSPLITTLSAPGTGQFLFTVPASWDPTQTYLILITAIDKAGNAAITSTPELNAGWEVVAGRTYSGTGGSGVTLQRRAVPNPYIATDKHGQLFDIGNDLQFPVFDARACRMIATTATPQVYDCPDLIVDPYGVPDRPWAYNPGADVFYSSARVQGTPAITALDFNRHTVTVIFGGPGTGSVSSSLPPGADARKFGASDLHTRLFFDTASQKLFLRTDAAFYAIDPVSYQLTFVLGGSSAAVAPEQQAAQSQLTLPAADDPFVVTVDQRIVLWGDKAAEALFNQGYGLQYVIEGVSPGNPQAPVTLRRISPNGGLPNSPDNRFYAAADVAYDPIGNRLFATLVSQTVAQMNLPPKGSNPDAYVWTTILLRGGNVAERDLLTAGPATVRYPITFQFAPSTLSYAGAGTLDVVNQYTGDTLQLQLGATSGTLSRIVGFPVGTEPDGPATDRRLTSPNSMFLDPQGNLVFDDADNLQRVTPAVNGENSVISTIFPAFTGGILRFDAADQRLIAGSYDSLRLYHYGQTVTLTAVVGSHGPTVPISGAGPAGLANDPTHPKSAAFFSSVDTSDGVSSMRFLWGTDFGPVASWPQKPSFTIGVGQILTDSDYLALGVDYCGTPANRVDCTQGPLANGSYAGDTYRVQSGGNGQMAFGPNDDRIFTCLNGSFAEIRLADDQIFLYQATYAGKAVACSGTFHTQDGNVYFTDNHSVYQIETSRIESANTAVLSSVPTASPLLRGSYNEIFLTDRYVYYSDTQTQRILRNARQ